MIKLLILVMLALAALATWVWSSRFRAKRRLTQKKAQEAARLKAEAEIERLTEEKRQAVERESARLAAEIQAQEDARLKVEADAKRLAEDLRIAEERAKAEAEAREKARLTEEQRVAAEKLAAAAEAKQRAEEEAREKARVAAEEEERAEERHQAEEQARAETESRERARLAAEEEARRQAAANVEKEKTPSESHVEARSPQKPQEADEAPRPPRYQPTVPPPTTAPSRPRGPTGSRMTQTANTDLHLRVQLVFGRGGVVRSLALAPDRRNAMPDEIEVTGTQGELHLTELREDCYEPVALTNAGIALLQGIEWRGRGDARQWRWVLGGRELYVLAPGDEFGLHGFVSTARLRLNARHVVLATKRLREEVAAALVEAGCATPEVSDDIISGVPAGWLLFRDVIPTRAMPMRDERDILNALCPAHEIEPHFIGGIRLERNTWLAGYPPRIRFTGEFPSGFEVKIDGHLAQRSSDGAYEAPGWNSEGEHRLWFGDQAETYSLCTMEEGWSHWHAHDFGIGAAICGAGVHAVAKTLWRQACIPTASPLLLGAQPGQILRCRIHRECCSENILVRIPFLPVWALPANPARADKNSAHIILLNSTEPIALPDETRPNQKKKRSVKQWAAAVRNAGRSQLPLVSPSEESISLWRSYRAVAKRLRRRKQ